ncbi:MAG: hypothetical protein RLZZ77_1244 [Bacteroidota bacterium]|jgi:iron complex transport system substrate-binding protein
MACTPPPQRASLPERIEKPEYAKGFEIHHYADHSLLILLNLEKSEDTLAVIRYSPNKQAKYACQSTTHVTLIEALGLSSQITACAYADRLSDSTLLARYNSGDLINLTNGDDLDKEKLWTSGAHYFFIYPFDRLAPDFAPKDKMTTVPISEYLEEHPLARAEWIKVFGELSGQSAEAYHLFNQLRDRYNSEKMKHTHQTKPSVFFGSKEGDVWFAGPGQSYIAQLIEDAGGSYLFSDYKEPGNISLSQEEMIAKTWDIDFFGAMVYQSEDPNAMQIREMTRGMEKAPTFSGKKTFFCNAARNDFFGSALLEPDLMLAELGHIFQQKSSLSGARYFKMTP